MKLTLLIIPALVFGSCMNSESNNNGAAADSGSINDSMNHSAHAGAGPTGTVQTGMDSSMMGLMHSNMAAMMKEPSQGSADRDFARLMQIHHQGAIDMAQRLLQGGSDPALKAMAQKMISDQKKEQAELEKFMGNAPSTQSDSSFYRKTMTDMRTMKMDMTPGGTEDQQFARMMIPHHQGAVQMAQTYLQSGAANPELRAMAQKMITEQQKEIAELQAWLKKNS